MDIRRISEYLITKKNKNHKMVCDLSFKISHVKNMMNFKIREQYFDNEIYNEFLAEVLGSRSCEEYKENRRYLNIGFIEKEIEKVPHKFIDENGKDQTNYYHELPKNMVQQIRMQLIKTWKGYFKTIAKNAKEKNGKKVGIPGYSRNQRSTVIISKNDFTVYYYKNYKDYVKGKKIKLQDVTRLPKEKQDKIRTELVVSPRKYAKNGLLLERGIYFIQEVKIIPNTDETYKIHVNYFQDKQQFLECDGLNEIQKRRKHIETKSKKDPIFIGGIDCGVRNLITMSIINKETKEVVKTYQIKKDEYKEVEIIDKQLEDLKSQSSKMLEEKYQELNKAEPIKGQKPHGWLFNTLDKLEQEDQLIYDQYQTLQAQIKELWTFRERVVKNIIQSISSKISQICNSHQVSILVFGKNRDMKDKMQGKVWNQFPHARMMKLLKYKLEDIGTKLVEQDEAYTSKSSYFELEPFNHNFTYAGFRKNEWFYRNNKKKYDADVHASLNIIRKYIESEVGERYIFPVGEPRIPLSKRFFVHCFLRY